MNGFAFVLTQFLTFAIQSKPNLFPIKKIISIRILSFRFPILQISIYVAYSVRF